MRHRKVKDIVQGHTASRWKSWYLNPGSSDPRSCAFNQHMYCLPKSASTSWLASHCRATLVYLWACASLRTGHNIHFLSMCCMPGSRGWRWILTCWNSIFLGAKPWRGSWVGGSTSCLQFKLERDSHITKPHSPSCVILLEDLRQNQQLLGIFV